MKKHTSPSTSPVATSASPELDATAPYIGGQSWPDFIEQVKLFHGYAAPGVLLGGIMVELARKRLPEGTLFDALAETYSCLPDAVQMLTACTIGNGWLKVLDNGRYALTLYDKYTGAGVRVAVRSDNLQNYPTLHDWLLNLVDKKDQDENQLREEIRTGGAKICAIEAIQVDKNFLGKVRKGRVVPCPICREPYPLRDGAICLGCQRGTPVELIERHSTSSLEPQLKKVPVDDAVGKALLHDMTQIIPGRSKGPVFKAGQVLNAGDLCQLHLMGRENVFLRDELPDEKEWVHENEVAAAFGKAMCGDGSTADGEAREGKVKISAAVDGLFIADEARLESFNAVPGVMCASRHSYTLVKQGQAIAGTRAIPLYLPRKYYLQATTILEKGALFKVLPLRKAKVGILVTGTEVFRGLVEDKFAAIVTNKVKNFDAEIVSSEIVPDIADEISAGCKRALAAGADLIVTTAGLSVDPDDVTRKGLLAAGLKDDLFGMPVLPGAMTLTGKIANAQILGVPACALFHKITAMDLLLPRLLAGLEIKRNDIAKLGHGGLCLECEKCSFPHCGFGK